MNIAIAQKPCDVREEIKMYGSDNTAETFQNMQWQRQELIHRQQTTGISGVMSNLNESGRNTTDTQRAVMKKFQAD